MTCNNCGKYVAPGEILVGGKCALCLAAEVERYRAIVAEVERYRAIVAALAEQKPRLEQLEEDYQPGLYQRRLADELLDTIATAELQTEGEQK